MVASDECSHVGDGCAHLEVVQPGVDVLVAAEAGGGEVWHHVVLHAPFSQQECSS